jgi:hypothetical protein
MPESEWRFETSLSSQSSPMVPMVANRNRNEIVLDPPDYHGLAEGIVELPQVQPVRVSSDGAANARAPELPHASPFTVRLASPDTNGQGEQHPPLLLSAPMIPMNWDPAQMREETAMDPSNYLALAERIAVLPQAPPLRASSDSVANARVASRSRKSPRDYACPFTARLSPPDPDDQEEQHSPLLQISLATSLSPR